MSFSALKNVFFKGSDEKESASSSSTVACAKPFASAASEQKSDEIEEKDKVADGGQVTAHGRLDWCKAHGIVDTSAIPLTVQADKDPNAPLYYWQLFSVLGMDMIRDIVADFYKSVFADTEEPWFRDPFVALNDIDRHIHVQTWYWADSMGGGLYYLGGETRVNFHHEYKGGNLMTGMGARRWMYHMENALKTGGHLERLNKVDRRAFPCLVDFLRIKMQKYSTAFNWSFDSRPFDELDQLHADSMANVTA